jgi:hypothetical protein
MSTAMCIAVVPNSLISWWQTEVASSVFFKRAVSCHGWFPTGATTKNPPKTGQKLTSALQGMMTSGSQGLLYLGIWCYYGEKNTKYFNFQNPNIHRAISCTRLSPNKRQNSKVHDTIANTEL